MGVLAGTKIWGHSPDGKNRERTVEDLNTGSLEGLVMTDRIGGCGHSMVGANHIIFLGSLYSKDGEKQAICTLSSMSFTNDDRSDLSYWSD